MPGGTCSYFNCTKNRSNNKGLKIFRFPTDNSLSREWILNSGNITLDLLSPKKLRNRYLCENHFQNKCFTNPNDKSRLNYGALPKKYTMATDDVDKNNEIIKTTQPSSYYTPRKLFTRKENLNADDILSPVHLALLTPEQTYSRTQKMSPDFEHWQLNSPTFSSSPKTKSYISELIQLPSPQIKKKEHKLEKVLELCKKQKKLLGQKRTKICLLKKQLNKCKTSKNNINPKDFLNTASFCSKNSKALVSMQLLHNKKRRWSQREKNIAVSIYYKSPTTYKYLRKNNVVLPGVSTIQSWLNSIKYMAGYNAEYNAQLKIMAKTMSVQEKKCVILIDEMSIKCCLEYNESLDMIEGYEDFGNLRRSGKSAKLLLVVMIRGLCNNWKLPLSYYFSSTGVKGNQLVEIMEQTVQTLIKLGFSPVCITCDQGTANRKMYTLLGGSSENPFTVIGGRKLFLIYDVPHLVKSVRNNLLTGNIVINKNGQKKIIDFEDFRNTYKIDKPSKTARALCKIDERHLYPNAWQKMNCKLAIQVFSHTVSAAMKTCVGTNQLISQTALDTADFFLEMNNLFDALNSKNLYDKNPNRRPMSENNDNIINILRNSLETFKNAEKKNKKTSPQETNNIPPCFIGFVWTINAILQLYESEKNEMGQFFLITNRLCQDALENLFSILRQKCGYNKNPTCRTFRCGFSSICSFSLLNCTSEKSNCEEDNDTFLTPNILSNTPSTLDTVDENKSTEVDLAKEIEVDEDSEIYDLDLEYEHNNEGGSLEECAVIYYAGYLAMKCLKKINCEKCQKTLLHPEKMLNDKNQLLLVHKTYNVNFDIDKGLKVPSKQLELFTKICLDTFKTKFPIIKSHSNLLSKLMDFATTNITSCTNINILDECSTHYKYIMKLLFVVRIHKEYKWTRNNNRTFIYNGTNKPNAKLRNIQNL